MIVLPCSSVQSWRWKEKMLPLLTLGLIPTAAYILSSNHGWETSISSAAYSIWQRWQLSFKNLHITHVGHVTAQQRWDQVPEQSLPWQQWLKSLHFLHVLSGLAARMIACSQWHQNASVWEFIFSPPQRIISVCWLLNEWLKSQIPQQPSSTRLALASSLLRGAKEVLHKARFLEPRCFSTGKGERYGKTFVDFCGITVCRQSKNCADHPGLLLCFSPYLLQSWLGKRRVVPRFDIKAETFGCYVYNSLWLSFLPLVVALKEMWAMKGNHQHFHVDMESSSGTAHCV